MDPNDQNSQNPMDGGQTPPMPSDDTGMGGDTSIPQGDASMPSTPPPVGDMGGGTEPEIAPPTPTVPEVGIGGGDTSSGQAA